MQSHAYANRLKEIADFLLSRPEFETETNLNLFIMHYEKDKFITTVRALGTGTKTFTGDTDYADLKFQPSAAPEIQVSIGRSKVCRKVQDVKWECEPILSPEEEAAIGTEAASDIPF